MKDLKISIGDKIVLKQTKDLPLVLKIFGQDLKDYDDNFAGRIFTVSNIIDTEFAQELDLGILVEIEEDDVIQESQKKKLNERFNAEFTKLHHFSSDYIECVLPKEITELSQTVYLMNSVDYRDRFKAEYYQLKIRTEKLQKMYDNWDNLDFIPTCSKKTYKMQLLVMNGYLDILKDRAKEEGIELC